MRVSLASRKLTLISAPAGFGKTTLVSEWIASPRHCPPEQVCGNSVAWLSLDEGDNDPARFISYLVAALQTIKPGIGEGLLPALQGPQPSQLEADSNCLTQRSIQDPRAILFSSWMITTRLILHRWTNALDFLVEHQPPQMHLVITTREDPQLTPGALTAPVGSLLNCVQLICVLPPAKQPSSSTR